MSEPIFSKCGMRCDLCLIYRPNVAREDRREEICAVYRKVFDGYSPDPATIICDGCNCMDEGAVRLEAHCKTRACVLEKGLPHCGFCDGYPCEIFPAEPSEEELVVLIDVQKKWTREDEKLMAAYCCKKHMDAFRKAFSGESQP